MKEILRISLILIIGGLLYPTTTNGSIPSERSLRCPDPDGFLLNLNTAYSTRCNQQQLARWQYMTDITAENEEDYLLAKNSFLQLQAQNQQTIIDEYSECDSQYERELRYLRIHGPGKMIGEAYENMTALLTKMEVAHATTKVCEYNNAANCNLYLDPDVEKIFQQSSDPNELHWYWTQWHDEINKVITLSDFEELIHYQKLWAEANEFSNMSDLWLQPYDDGTSTWTPSMFKETMESFWTNDLKPLYSKLHSFVRMQLRNNPNYKTSIKRYGSLPLHLTGHIWSQNWLNLDEATKPNASVPTLDATQAMLNADYTIDQILIEVDNILTSLGLGTVPRTNNFLQRPTDGREVICEASAEDMCTGAGNTDFRLKLCAEVSMKDLLRITKYAGFIEYFKQYMRLNYIFRNGANPAFLEGLASTFSLMTSTPHYLECKLGLDLDLSIDCSATTTPITELDINYLYRIALEKFPLFSHAMSMNLWRWEIEGTLTPEQLSTRFFEIRREQQGVIPLESRPANRFDPVAIPGIISENDEFSKAFIGNILTFQIFEGLCIAAGEYDPTDDASKPLHQCDFSGNSEVQQRIRNCMASGFIAPWPDMLNLLTGNNELSIEPIVHYFKPLFDELDSKLEEASESPCFGKDCQLVAKEYVQHEYETESSKLCNNATLASFNYQTDLTNPDAERENNEASLRYSRFLNEEWSEKISQFDYELFDESDEKRQLKFLNAVGVAALETSKLEQYNQILSDMSKVYGTAKLCPYNKRDCDLETEGMTLEPGLENILANSRHYNELAYIWRGWRDATGKLMRENYNQYIDLSNEAANLNGFENMGDFWILRYESETFKQDMANIYDTVSDLYEELHAYVRFRLKQTYPQLQNLEDPIPAHLLGNMWSQTWGNIYSLVIPFPNAPIFDVTDQLKKYFNDDLAGVRSLFRIANGFFTQSGLADMSMAYGDSAMIIKPTDGREVICHASAWDFCDGKDFRIKQCTNIDMEDFITVHHELGHIQYDLQYKNLNITFREGANPGFHEAIGDVVSLSVATPKHMYKIGLGDSPVTTHESTINYLMKMALDKVAFLPFGFLIDAYRWQVFDGQIPRQNLTYNWWKMRNQYQGIIPPFKRNENDFDAGAKYHVPADVPYIRYFVSYILQFQIHRELCTIAREFDPNDPNKPLHNCDIYANKAAGAKFKEILQAGASKNWQELLQEAIGTRDLDASALLDYFQPLLEFFQEQRALHDYPKSWDNNAFEFYFGDGELPSTPNYDNPSTTEENEQPTAETTDSNNITEEPTPPTTTPEEDEGTNVAIIVIGAILGVTVVVVLVGYFVQTKFRKPKQDRHNLLAG